MSPTSTRKSAATATSILPILIAQGILNADQVSQLEGVEDNVTLELYLKQHQLASDDQILAAYGQLYGIPVVHLKGRSIAPEVLHLIPELTARRYDMVAYERQGDVVSIALATPRRFQNLPKAGLLQRLQQELGVKVAPTLAPLPEIRTAFAGYETSQRPPITADKVRDEATVQVATTTNYPVVSLIGKTIALATLQRVPRDVAQHYQLVIFAEPVIGQLSMATVDPASKSIQQIVQFLQDKNKVKIDLYRTDPTSLAMAMAQYDLNDMADKDIPAAPAKIPESPVKPLPIEQPSAAQVRSQLRSVPQPQYVQPPSQLPVTSAPPSVQPPPKAPPIKAVETNLTQALEITAEQLAGAVKAPAVGTAHTKGPTTSAEENTIDDFVGIQVTSVQDLATIIRSGNIPKMVAGIISLAIAVRASDVHIEAEKERIRLRYRIDGELQDVMLLPNALHAPLVSRIKILSQLKIDENRIPQDGRFGVTFQNREIDLRVSTLPAVHGEKVVIRILDKTTGIMSLEDMGLDGINLKRLTENAAKPYGIVLSTGPTGSGKSTTLYAILQRISQPNVNVVTLEDPVEYEMAGINQVQIKPKIGFTFAEGLRSILRQDPNIIMVGEIRDKETAEMATHSALTGHLVLSTLHTNSAAGALPRLINMGIEPFLITSSINAVEAQRLVRRVCQKCKTEDKLPQGVIDEIQKDLANSNVDPAIKDPSQWHFSHGTGCPECKNGYRGRIGIFEVLTMSDEIEALAVKKEPASVLETQALKEGMITMKQDGLVKALHGQTTVEEVMKATTE